MFHGNKLLVQKQFTKVQKSPKLMLDKIPFFPQLLQHKKLTMITAKKCHSFYEIKLLVQKQFTKIQKTLNLALDIIPIFNQLFQQYKKNDNDNNNQKEKRKKVKVPNPNTLSIAHHPADQTGRYDH